MVIVLGLVPAGPDADVQSPTRHLIDGRGQLGQVARMPERHR
jgi:hypothetical protein